MILTEILLLSFLVPSISTLGIPLDAARAVGLLPRANPVCGGNTNLTQCGGSFPSDFCCSTGSTCFGFNSNQSVVCCPEKQCAFINMLSCDPAVYNATTFPSSPIHMSDLSPDAYIQCSGTNSCCPKGYTCSGGGCKINTTENSVNSSLPPGTTPTGSAAPTSLLSLTSAPTQGTGSTVSPGAIAASTNSPSASPAPPGPQFPLEAVLVGLFPGLAGGCLLTFLLICCLGRRKAKKLSSDSSSSLGPTVAKISDPIYSVDPTATRTDFLRHASRRIVKKASRPLLGSSPPESGATPNGDSSISRMRSLFRKTPTSASIRSGSNLWGSFPAQRGNESSMPDPKSAAERALDSRLGRMDTTSMTAGPRTPRREPSMESIPIYNNTPDAGGYERNTVFADLLPAVDSRDKSPVPKIPSPPVRKQSAGLMPPIHLGSPTGAGRRGGIEGSRQIV